MSETTCTFAPTLEVFISVIVMSIFVLSELMTTVEPETTIIGRGLDSGAVFGCVGFGGLDGGEPSGISGLGATLFGGFGIPIGVAGGSDELGV
jgi:hypothetical protein